MDFMFIKRKETNNLALGQFQKYKTWTFIVPNWRQAWKFCQCFNRFVLFLLFCAVCTCLCSFPASGHFPHVSHLCLLPRPLVYISQAFRMLVATLSGLVSKQWFSICGETCVLTFCFLFPGFWDFACMILYLCCDFCLSSFWFGLNKDRELLHLCAPASLCPPACEFLTNFTFLLKLKVLGRSSSAVWSCARWMDVPDSH